jgi:hypothetical protein
MPTTLECGKVSERVFVKIPVPQARSRIEEGFLIC